MKLNALREERNWDGNESVGLLTWMLKSPVRTNHWDGNESGMGMNL